MDSPDSSCLDVDFPTSSVDVGHCSFSSTHDLVEPCGSPCNDMDHDNMSPYLSMDSQSSPCLDVDSDGSQAGISSQLKVHEVSSSESDVEILSTQDSSVSGASQKEKKQLEKQRRKEELLRKREEAVMRRQEKQRQREEKAKQKEEKLASQRAQRDLKKQEKIQRDKMKPGECLKYINIEVDEVLFRTVLCIQAIQVFPHASVTFAGACQPVQNSITWSRTQDDGSKASEDWVVVVWEGDKVAQAIAESTLISQFKQICSIVGKDKTVLIFIFALEHYYRKSQNAGNAKKKHVEAVESEINNLKTSRYLKRDEVDLGLVELQIYTGVCHYSFETSTEFAELLGHLTRAIAEAPLRNEREAVDKDMGWSARSYNKNSIRVNKDLQGLDKLWLQHLNVFSHTNLDTVRAIAAIYPTPTALVEAYENCSCQKEKESLLQNLEVNRGSGGSKITRRRLGPELSRKMYQLFTQTDGLVTLSSSSQ